MPWIELIKGFRWWQGPMTLELERDTSERLSRPPINLVTRNGVHVKSAGRRGRSAAPGVVSVDRSRVHMVQEPLFNPDDITRDS